MGNTNIILGDLITTSVSATTYYNLPPSGISGSGSTGQIAFFDTSSSLSGTTSLTYNNGNISVFGSISGNTIISSTNVEARQNLKSLNSSGDEGGEIFLAQPQTNNTLSGGITIDAYQNKLRIFEQGGSNRGVYIDLTNTTAGPGTDLLSPAFLTSTSSVIHFSANTIFGTYSSPLSSNLTNSLTNAKLGVIQKIYHNSGTAPTVPAGWVLLGSTTYQTSTLNIIYAEWSEGTRVEYWIVR